MKAALSPPLRAPLGIEERLWRAAEGLRGHVEPAEYKHVVLSLLFFRAVADDSGGAADLPGPRILPPGATWADVTRAARAGEASQALARATAAIERENPQLRGLFTFEARSAFDAVDGERLAELVVTLGDAPLDAGRDMLGRTYEYFLARFASSEGRSGGEYYTPRCVVQLLVEMIRPLGGTIYDPCCGSGGMFVQSAHFVAAHAGDSGPVALFGQESSARTRRLAQMNLALRGMKADLGDRPADAFRADLHGDLRADFVLANPPFNQRLGEAARLAGDPRWRFGAPPRSSANSGWLQHVFAHLAPEGVGAVVLANGSLSSTQADEAGIRRAMIEGDAVECVVALPPQLFYGTPIPACVWLLSPSKTRGGARGLAGRTLFVDARARGRLVDRVHAELSDDDVAAIAGAYRRWREGTFDDVPGFAKSATLDEVRFHKHALVPGRYVGFARERLPPLDARGIEAELAGARARLAEVEAASDRFREAFRSVLESARRG
jgi:type I restriction enzyme M protein